MLTLYNYWRSGTSHRTRIAFALTQHLPGFGVLGAWRGDPLQV